MKQTYRKLSRDASLVMIPCLTFSAFVICTGISGAIFEGLNPARRLLIDEILLVTLFGSFGLLCVIGLNYRMLFKEVERRQEAEEEVRVLRHAGKARAAEIMLALDENEFQIYYQPIVELQTERVKAFEALVRWNHPTHGVLSPASFMPFIEESDLIVPLTRFMLRGVARQIAVWNDAFPADFALPTVSINLSWQHNAHSDLIADVREVLSEFEDFVPRHLCFELTETTAAQNIEQAIKLTARLRQLGIAVSIDDFGTGYSSLSYLGDLPATSVKIDRSFIKRMLEQSRSDILVRSIIRMAHELNLTVVAEGVETEEQKKHLLALGCEAGQGYLFARPLPALEAQFLLSEQLNAATGKSFPETLLDYIIDTA